MWESIAEESCDIAMDCSSFQMPHHSNAASRLKMDSSIHDMAVDELSFYDDDNDVDDNHTSLQREHRTFSTSPLLMDLLSEGSPKRFQIVDKTIKNKLQHRQQQSFSNNHQKLQYAANVAKNTTKPTTATTAVSSSSNTPGKSLRMFNSLSSSGSIESSMDDEYMELFEMESLEQQICQANLKFPSDLNSLISGQIKSSPPVAAAVAKMPITPEMRRPSVRRCLSMTENYQNQPKTPELLKGGVQETAAAFATATANNLTPYSSRRIGGGVVDSTTPSTATYCFKRPEPPTTCSPVQIKRYRGVEKENLKVLRKSMSMNDAEILSALTRSDCKDEPDLIGDFSRPFALPIMDGRHRDLKSISSDTVARLINGDFDDEVASYKIIDCRYPYEYDGGHIRGAQNLYTQEQIIEEFLKIHKTEELHQQQPQPQPQSAAHSNGIGIGKRHIIIFHCEFSSERGPKLSRFLRNNDRARNTNAYPVLDYPEMYLLHNGYKEFFETHSELCTPNAYRPMLEPSYSEAYRHFRAKSKSWNGDGYAGGGSGTSRLKKPRSRLML